MTNTKDLASRRGFLMTAGAAMTAAAMPAVSAEKKGHHHHHHHHHGKHSNLVDTSEECVATGKTCLNHCLVLLGEGDTSMAECSKNVNELVPVCEAMATLALSDSTNLKAMAKICLATCKSCAAACEEHIKDHIECKDCYDACNRSVEVVEAYLNAA